MKSKVYFTDLRTSADRNLLYKLENLVKKAGIEKINFKDQFTAIKIHFGEPGNLAFLRPNFAYKIVDVLQKLGAKVFLTDCNTLYSGGRSNAIDHLNSAMINGYNPISANAQIIIADGLKGIDYVEVLLNGEYCKTAKIGAAIANSDIIITMSHVKGHELAGFGGTLKNIGMGCASIGGKMELHSVSKPVVIKKHCIGCGICVKNCAHKAITLDKGGKALINYELCTGCGQCVAICQYSGVISANDETSILMNKKIAEYSKAVVVDKPHFHIGFMIDVSPECDCWNYNDAAVVPNIGIAASFDPVALDTACAEMINRAPILESSNILKEKVEKNHCNNHQDKWKMIHPDTTWQACVEHAEKIGLGSRQYELITV